MNDKAAPLLDSNTDTGFLKLIALVTMTIDHIGAVLFPELLILRLIGRISFPLFAYCLVVGCLYTHDMRRYLLRLAGFALVSQPFYLLALYGTSEDTLAYLLDWNIYVTLLFGALAIHALMQKNGWLFAAVLCIACFTDFDYGLTGVFLIVLFYLFRKSRAMSAVGALCLLTAAYGWQIDFALWGIPVSIQFLCVLALPLILIRTNLHPRIPKYFFYAYYPAHLFLLILLRLCLR